MRRKTKLVTAQTVRNRASDGAYALALATVALGVLVVERIRPAVPGMTDQTTVIVVAALGLVGAVATIVVLARRPKALVPGLPRRGTGKEERRLGRRLYKIWVRACRDSGLTREQGTDAVRSVDCPRITQLRPTPLGLRMVVQPMPGQAAEDVAARADNLASALGVWVRAEVMGPDRVALTAEQRQPLANSREAPEIPALDAETMGVEIAVNEMGEALAFEFSDGACALMAGIPGAGKTSAATILTTPLLLSEYAEVHIIDGKGGADWAWAAPCATSYTNDDENLEDVADRISEINGRMRERLKDVPDDQPSNFWNRPRTVENPFVLLVIDECQTFFAAKGRSKEKRELMERMAADVENIAKKGRSAGVFVLLMTQKPTSDAIPTAIRDQAARRLSFRVMTREAENAVLGEMPEDCTVRATDIPAQRVGGAVMDVNGQRQQIRVNYLAEERAAAAIREKADTATAVLPVESEPMTEVLHQEGDEK